MSHFLVIAVTIGGSCSSQALEIRGGTLSTVIELDSGSAPGQMLGHQDGAGSCHPDAFDIDKDGNFYLQNPGNARIQVFSRKGKFLREIRINEILKDRINNGYRLAGKDIAVSNSGAIYIVDAAKSPSRPHHKRLVKFTRSGKLSRTVQVPDAIQFSPLLLYIDSSDKVFLKSDFATRVFIYDKDLRLLGEFETSKGPMGYGNFAVSKLDKRGRIYYLRDLWLNERDKYVLISTVSNIREGVFVDFLRLPDELTQDSVGLLGCDLHNNLYFFADTDPKYPGLSPIRKDFREFILRYQIRGDSLVKTGEISLDDFGGMSKDELRHQASGFVRRYLVSGKGEIYLLHGSIKKMLVSQLLLD